MIENRRLARNAVWNLLSLTAPMLVALGAIPALIRTLGTERFSVLTLAWMMIGYCSLFDFGLGRALTKLVSEETQTDGVLASSVWTALSLMFALGCCGAVAVFAASSILAHSVFQVPFGLQHETMISLRWIALAIPLVTLTAGLRGILEARQRFGSLSVLRVITGALTFAGPLAVAKLFGGLPAVIITLAAIRLLSLAAHAMLCAALTPELLSDRRIRLEHAGPLFRFGGWLTISNLISPLMVSMDRFLVGIILPMTNVAYYATPYEIVTKMQVIPAAIMGVLFPAFSSSLIRSRPHSRQLFVRALAVILVVLTPLTAIAMIFAYPGLRLWLGDDFAAHGYRVLQLLAVGVLINAAAFVPACYVQAAGRPDVNAKLHMIEFMLYLPLVWWAIHAYGIEGAAFAWVLRVTADSALLFWMARRLVPANTGIALSVPVTLRSSY